jgi:hypothetical protein
MIVGATAQLDYHCIRATTDAFLMQIARASCSSVRVMRILHPADPPRRRNQGTSHDLPKLAGAAIFTGRGLDL